MGINPELLRLARERVGIVKQADPMGGGMPMDPSMGGGMPMDPSMGGGQPPAAMGGAPAVPGAAAAGLPPAPPQPMQDPNAMAAGGKKMKPEEITQSYRDYNTQVMLTAIINHLGITIPPEALLTPPNAMGAPAPEQAMPGTGSPIDMATQAAGQQAQQGGGGAQQSAIQPVEPMQAAMPQAGGQQKAGQSQEGEVGQPVPTTLKTANDLAARLRLYTSQAA